MENKEISDLISKKLRLRSFPMAVKFLNYLNFEPEFPKSFKIIGEEIGVL